jgi:hypothetical protein
VSGTGTDTGNCDSLAAACRQISFALTKTDAYGTVHALAGSYDGFDITSPVDIVAAPGTATVISGGAQAISIAANRVRIKGLSLDGFSGVIVTQPDSVILSVEDCSIIYGAAAAAIGFDFRTTGGASTLSLIRTNFIRTDFGPASNAVRIRPTGAASVIAVLDDVHIDRPPSGIVVDGRATTGTNAVTIRDSTVAGSTTFGVNAVDGGGGSTSVVIEGSTVSSNAAQGVVSNGVNTTVRMRDSTVTGNARGIIFANSGKLISQGGNVVSGNTVDGVFSSTVAQK